jgi:hypothetical protein
MTENDDLKDESNVLDALPTTQIDITRVANLREILKEYGHKTTEICSMQLGYDNHLYVLLSSNIPMRGGIACFTKIKIDSIFSVLEFVIDWEKETVKQVIHLDLGQHFINFCYIQPIGDKLLLVCPRMDYEEPSMGNNAEIVDRTGKGIMLGCLGDAVGEVIVTESSDIITSYFDEGVYAWEDPISGLGVRAWDDKLRENSDKIPAFTQDEVICMFFDECKNFWYKDISDFKLRKVSPADVDTVYKPYINGMRAFLVYDNANKLLADGGRAQRSTFYIVDVSPARDEHTLRPAVLIGHMVPVAKIEFISNGENVEDINSDQSAFRTNKAVFIDEAYNIYLKAFQ